MQGYGSNTNYHSLQMRHEHRLSKQLSMTAAYTYSHLIDDSANTTNDGGCQCQNPRNIAAECASSLFVQRHLFVSGFVWNIPVGNILESSDTQNNDGIYERPLLMPGQKFSVPHQ